MHEMTHNLHLVRDLRHQRSSGLEGLREPKKREEHRRVAAATLQLSPFSSRSPTPTASTSVTPTPPPEPMITSIGEPLQSDYQMHELPTSDGGQEASCPHPDINEVVVNTALLARIEALESQNCVLTEKLQVAVEHKSVFGIDNIAGNDKLVNLYTGFPSDDILLAFFEFLGPAVANLNYWGEKERERIRHRQRKLDPVDQFLLMLMKLKLNLHSLDLAVRFGISESLVSRYITTWVCFLYQHLKEIEWMPTVEQVTSTLPHAFRDKYPTTFAIIDGSEVFIETPSDLQMQSSTWSNYKHHNTTKFLIACTPNGVSATSHHCTLVLFQMWSSRECQVLFRNSKARVEYL